MALNYFHCFFFFFAILTILFDNWDQIEWKESIFKSLKSKRNNLTLKETKQEETTREIWIFNVPRSILKMKNPLKV